MQLAYSNTRETGIDTLFYWDVITGLAAPRKSLPCKYLYDQKGSELFEQITQLDEYYLTRTEISILRRAMPDIRRLIGPHAKLIELGSGSGIKTEILLHGLQQPASYTPIDISENALKGCAQRIASLFTRATITPVVADYMQRGIFEKLSSQQPYHVFFPGSTVGNLLKSEAQHFLSRLRMLIGSKGGVLIGVDCMKEENVLLSAYDDATGITAQFNKNLLTRINCELEGQFDPEAFDHKAVVNHAEERVEMHLVSQCEQSVRVAGLVFHFLKDQTIHTENSHKYTHASFTALAESSGLRVHSCWTDEKHYFGLYYLTAL